MVLESKEDQSKKIIDMIFIFTALMFLDINPKLRKLLSIISLLPVPEPPQSMMTFYSAVPILK